MHFPNIQLSTNQSETGEETRRQSYRSQRKGHRSSRGSRTKLIAFLSFLLVIETGAILIMLVKLSMSEKENLELVISERNLSQEISSLRPRVEKLQDEVMALTEGRLPDLKALEFDSVVPIEQDYAKNIVFTTAGKGDSKHYEYKMVLHNTGLSQLHPQVDILFFDRVGIQVGLSRIGVRGDGTPNLDILDRGEIRSYSSKLDLIDDVKPEYFLVKLRR